MSEAWKLFHLQAYFSHQRCTFSCCCFSCLILVISTLLSWSGQYFLFLCIVKANNQIRYSCSKPNKLFGQGNRRKWYTLVWHTVQDNSYFNNNHYKLEQYPIYYSTAPPISLCNADQTDPKHPYFCAWSGTRLFWIYRPPRQAEVAFYPICLKNWHLLIKDQRTVKLKSNQIMIKLKYLTVPLSHMLWCCLLSLVVFLFWFFSP